MIHGSDKGERKRRWRETANNWHHYKYPKGYFLWDAEMKQDYIKTLYRSWERGLDTSVFRHHKSKERK